MKYYEHLNDMVLVVEYGKEVQTQKNFGGEALDWEGKPRVLLVLFNNRGTYQLACQANKAVLSDNEGGMMGDPLQNVAVDRGCVVTSFFGGSNEKWDLTYRYRYQNGNFYLIGATNTGGNGEWENMYDYNLSTGKLVVEKTDDRHPKKNQKYQQVIKPKQLPLLQSFEPWSLVVAEGITF